MLNLPIAMVQVYIYIIIVICSGLLPAGLIQAQTAEPGIEVLSPLPGSALQGNVVISGSTDLPGFQTSEVDFSYGQTGLEGWFLIQQSQQPVKAGTLAVWDTSKIADGNYRLRVQVTLQDGRVVETTIDGLRVRNYTIVETSTPTQANTAEGTMTQAPTKASETPIPLTSTPLLSPTTFPANPAQLQPRGLLFNLAMGMAFVVSLFFLLGIYLWAKGKSH
jgi:hypothetical protein